MRLKILHYNCSGLPLLSGRLWERLFLITNSVREMSPDVLAFEEIFTLRGLRFLRRHLLDWPFCFYATRGLYFLSGGIVVFSKIPILKAYFLPYREQGPLFGYSLVTRLNRKGIIVVETESPRLVIVHTHLLSRYSPPCAYTVNRQARQLAGLVKKMDKGLPLVLSGDLNLPPDYPAYRRLTESVGLVDVMGEDAPPSLVSGPLYRRWGFRREPERVDYVFFRGGTSADLKLVSARYVMESPVRIDRGVVSHLSDHLGILAEFEYIKEN